MLQQGGNEVVDYIRVFADNHPVTSVKLVEIRDCGSRRPDAVAPVEGCLQSVRLRAAIDGMADCAAAAAPLSSPAPDGAPLRGCGA
jgi:hypothetical protein